MDKCTGMRCPMQVGYKVEECDYKDCPYRTEPMTNADRIREMSDEELAKYLYQMQKNILRYVATVIGYSEEFDFADEAPDLLEWLQQPAEVDHAQE